MMSIRLIGQGALIVLVALLATNQALTIPNHHRSTSNSSPSTSVQRERFNRLLQSMVDSGDLMIAADSDQAPPSLSASIGPAMKRQMVHKSFRKSAFLKNKREPEIARFEPVYYDDQLISTKRTSPTTSTTDTESQQQVREQFIQNLSRLLRNLNGKPSPALTLRRKRSRPHSKRSSPPPTSHQNASATDNHGVPVLVSKRLGRIRTPGPDVQALSATKARIGGGTRTNSQKRSRSKQNRVITTGRSSQQNIQHERTATSTVTKSTRQTMVVKNRPQPDQTVIGGTRVREELTPILLPAFHPNRVAMMTTTTVGPFSKFSNKLRRPRRDVGRGQVGVDDLLFENDGFDQPADEELLDEDPMPEPDQQVVSEIEPWLRKEYYKNVAKTLAMAGGRRRRSTADVDDESEDFGEEDIAAGGVPGPLIEEVEDENRDAEQDINVLDRRTKVTADIDDGNGVIVTQSMSGITVEPEPQPLPVAMALAAESPLGDDDDDGDIENDQGRTRRRPPPVFDLDQLSDDYLFAMKEDDDEQLEQLEQQQPANNDQSPPVVADDDEDPEAAADVGDEDLTGGARRKRKRSVPASFFGKIDYEPSVDQLLGDANIGGDQLPVDDGKYYDIDGKLKRIEEALLTEALDIIGREHAIGGGGADKNNDVRIANRYAAAYDLEDIRVALNDLKDKTQQLANEPFDRQDEPLLAVMSEAQQADDRVAADGRGPNNNGYDAFFDSNGFDELTSGVNDEPEPVQRSNSVLPEPADDQCPLESLVTDCGVLRDTKITTRLDLISACNWHEICYACGDSVGLLEGECDAGFVELTRLSCRHDQDRCSATAAQMIKALRQRRSYLGRVETPTVCQATCISDYLALNNNRKR